MLKDSERIEHLEQTGAVDAIVVGIVRYPPYRHAWQLAPRRNSQLCIIQVQP